MSFDEYRFLTFLFCDLVDSTPTSQSLDAEDWRDLLHGFQACCAEVVDRYGGRIHDSPGDGLLAYFGYPATNDDSALNAVRAGMRLSHAGESCFDRENRILRRANLAPLRVRIGIHTGRVVMGKVDGKDTATGFALPFTERLHQCAAPNTVVLGHTTFELVKSRIRVASLGKKSLKGIDNPVTCYLALSEVEPRRQRLACCVGRRAEAAVLGDEWRQVLSGSTRSVLVTGEAGIGKSRLVEEFIGAREDRVRVQLWQCSFSLRSNALHPVIGYARQLLDDRSAAEPVDHVTRLEGLLPETVERARVVPAIASLLSIPVGSRYSMRHGSATRRKSIIQDALVEWIACEARRQPLILLVEDVQWIDSSTTELLEQLVRRHAEGGLLVLMTCRTERSSSWSCPFPARLVELGRLDADACRELIASMPEGEILTDDEIGELVDRTDGVPLFIEESAVMAADRESSAVDAWSGREQTNPVPLPLMDLLVERLDRVGEARDTAGIASAIGREFSYPLLKTVSPLDESDLSRQLRALTEAGLIQNRTENNVGTLAFKHALVRDAAYGTLLTSRRRDYHRRIAEALQAEPVNGEPAHPGLLAYHYTRADVPDKAVDLWLEAGSRARQSSEQNEAISHYLRVPELLNRLDDRSGYPVKQKAIKARIALAGCHAVIDGYGSESAGRSYEIAERLALETGDFRQLLKARFGLATYHFMRGDFARASKLVRSCHDTASRVHEGIEAETDKATRIQLTLLLAQACLSESSVMFHEGRFRESLSGLNRVLELCGEIAVEDRSMVQDPAVVCLCYKAWYAWEDGDADEALAIVEGAVVLARRVGHSFTIGLALAFHACVHLFRGEHAQTIERAGQCIATCEEPGFCIWLAWAKVLRGRALSEERTTRTAGIAEILDGLRMWDASGAMVTRAFTLTLLAEAYELDGRFREAFERIREAKATVERIGERYYEAEINRVYANLVLRCDEAEPESARRRAERAYRHAVRFASERGMFASAAKARADHERYTATRQELPLSAAPARS